MKLSLDLNFDKAIEKYHRIIHILHEHQDPNEFTIIRRNEIRTRVFADLANIYLLKKDHKKAEELLTQAIREAVSSGIQPSHAMVVEMSLKLALIYAEANENAKAASGFEFCIQTQQEKLKSSDLDPEEKHNELALLGMSQNYYSKHLYEVGDYQDALKLTLSALESCQSVYSSEHVNCLNIVLDKAQIQSKLDTKKSRETLQELLSSLKKKDNSFVNKEVYVTGLLQLTLLEAFTSNYQQAEVHLEEARSTINRSKELKNLAGLCEHTEKLLRKWAAEAN
ncbi:hypothetical protein Ciccas_011254 [Cichlidogyrus casuarinus]|uniref:Uncharacterized protein n=1 Tax=Cichlidogyrus casuarinus TaxID=1844966 RepID=A0ABD2PRT6_9PLAT